MAMKINTLLSIVTTVGLSIGISVTSLSSNAFAKGKSDEESIIPKIVAVNNDVSPLSMSELLAKTPQISEKDSFGVDAMVNDGVSLDVRKDAQTNAALSYGARGGLAFRSHEINESLKSFAPSLDKVFNFRRLLIKASSGLLIEPPIITEAQNTLLIADNGIEAAVADRIYNIIKDAKIVTAPRDWRQYIQPLTVDADIKIPPKILWPTSPEEKNAWDDAFTRGWTEGVEQANQIFESNLETLISDFNGMIRYRVLLAQNIISAPYALNEDRGITGGGDELRIGDRAIRITGPSEFRTGYEEWQPADR